MQIPIRDVIVRPNLAKILKVFLEDPEKERFGHDLMGRTGLRSGAVYPALQRLQAAGWLVAEWEQIDPTATTKPPRKLYRLTTGGDDAARAKLAELADAYTVPDA